MPKKIGVLFSGGLDSAALIAKYLKDGERVFPIYVKGNLAWEKTERYWSEKFLKAMASPRLNRPLTIALQLGNSYRSNWSQSGKIPGAKSRDNAVYLPARNLLLLTRAALFLTPLKVNTIALATLAGNPFPDGKESYFALLSRILTQSFRRPIRILSPFRHKHKSQLLNEFPRIPFELTFSCINPRRLRHCGRCNKCAERKKAFRQAKRIDPTNYALKQ